jgi:hypothetical protein
VYGNIVTGLSSVAAAGVAPAGFCACAGLWTNDMELRIAMDKYLTNFID